MLDLTLFLPELVLLVGGIVVLVIDALLRDRGKGEARLGWLALPFWLWPWSSPSYSGGPTSPCSARRPR